MILPTKHVSPDRALIGVGAEILRQLPQTATVSQLWNDIRSRRSIDSSGPVIDYSWFVLALDLLYTIGAIDLQRGLVSRSPTADMADK